MPTVSEGGQEDEAADQQLIRSFREALRADHPVAMLEAVSAIMTALDPRRRNPFTREEEPGVTISELADSFVHVDIAETTAALTVIAVLTPDELLTTRLRKAVASRSQPMHAWLDALDGGVEVTDTVMLTHIQGDGDDYLLGARLPTGEELTALVYVDHNIGSIVKDAFVVPQPFAAVLERMQEIADDPDQRFVEEDRAQVRAVVTEAIDHGAITFPPVDTDTWPACRPLVEWLVRQLPEGGAVPERHEWTEEERRQLADEFFSSRHGAGLDGVDERALLDDFIWYGNGWGSGDPLVWSPVRMELLLTDWIPRKIVADTAYLAKAPDLLRAYVRFCHERGGLRADLTTETVQAVDHWEPEYQRLIRTDRPQGAEALARMLMDQGEYDDLDDRPFEELMLESLERAVGGRSNLTTLDATPLPDEPFVWAGIPDDIHERVAEVLDLCDRCADELLDVEHRTAMRRFLSRAAAADPAIFRRKGKPERAAAAVAWVIAKANDTVGYAGAIAAQELIGWFGVNGSVSQRAEPFLRANGVNPYELYGRMDLGTADLLTAERRADILEARKRYGG